MPCKHYQPAEDDPQLNYGKCLKLAQVERNGLTDTNGAAMAKKQSDGGFYVFLAGCYCQAVGCAWFESG